MRNSTPSWYLNSEKGTIFVLRLSVNSVWAIVGNSEYTHLLTSYRSRFFNRVRELRYEGSKREVGACGQIGFSILGQGRYFSLFLEVTTLEVRGEVNFRREVIPPRALRKKA